MSKMKDLKRAYRRQMQYTILKRRARINFAIHQGWGRTQKTWAEYWEVVSSGKSARWMRTLSKPCSCEICSASYQRPSKGEVNNLIQDNLLD